MFGFLYFGMLDTGRRRVIFTRDRAVADPARHDVRPAGGADRRELHGRLRYSGASLGYQLASVIAGGPAPLIATWLFGTYHTGYAIAGYIAVCAVISLVATAMMPDYTGKDISGEYEVANAMAVDP